jgi:NADH-quinone oxidoreductase subunit E
MEVECLGACVNAPMLQIDKDFYEDIDGPITEQLIADLRAGRKIKPGPQNGRRVSSEPEGGALSLTDPALYDGSVVGKYHKQVAEPASDQAPTQKPPGAAS